jgi:hypothetical protein
MATERGAGRLAETGVRAAGHSIVIKLTEIGAA